MIRLLYRHFIASVLDIDSGTKIYIFAISQPISVHDLGHVLLPAAGWSMHRSPGIMEACVNVYDFGQGCSGTFSKQTISKHFRNLNVGSLLCLTLVNSVLESVTLVTLADNLNFQIHCQIFVEVPKYHCSSWINYVNGIGNTCRYLCPHVHAQWLCDGFFFFFFFFAS